MSSFEPKKRKNTGAFYCRRFGAICGGTTRLQFLRIVFVILRAAFDQAKNFLQRINAIKRVIFTCSGANCRNHSSAPARVCPSGHIHTQAQVHKFFTRQNVGRINRILIKIYFKFERKYEKKRKANHFLIFNPCG